MRNYCAAKLQHVARLRAPRQRCRQRFLEVAHCDLQIRAARLAAMKGQIAYFFGQERAYFPIDAGIRDDSASTGIQMLLPSDDHPEIPNARTWHYYDPERPDLLDAAAEAAHQKADTHGNVYITRTLFERKRATKDSAKAVT